MQKEDEGGDVPGSKGGGGDLSDGIVKGGGFHGAQAAGPTPVGGDEGLGEGFDGFGQGEHGTAEGELKSNEVDAEDGGFFGGAHEGGDAETDGAHSGTR